MQWRPKWHTMRILHVNKFLYRRGGAEAYMLDLAELQRRAGHAVEFFGMRHAENDPQRYESWFPSQVDLDPVPDSTAQRLATAGRMVWSTSARRGIARTIDDFRPDVVHFHNIYHQLSPSILGAAARRQCATVLTLHDYKLACPTHNFLRDSRPCEECLGGHFSAVVRHRCQGGSAAASALLAVEMSLHSWFRAYDPVQTFVCPSTFLRGRMEAAGVFPDRLETLPHFVDVASLTPRSAPGAGVFYAGRLSDEKGVDVLVRAAGLLPPGTSVRIAGDGPERDRLDALAETCAPGRIEFLGRITRSEVLEEMRRSELVALPSRCYENQPIAVLEAFGLGVPVVGSRLGGVPELITPGVTGALAEPNDHESLAAALGSLLGNPDRSMECGAAARRFVEDGFSSTEHLRRLDAVYERGVAARRSR